MEPRADDQISGPLSTNTHDRGDHRRRRAGRSLVAAAAVVLAATAAVAGCSDDDDASPATTDVTEGSATDDSGGSAAEQVAVDIVDIEQAFEPATITVAAGGEVTWGNADDIAHTATAEDGTWDSGSIEPGGEFTFTADEPGTYSYICSFHPNMQGELVVE